MPTAVAPLSVAPATGSGRIGRRAHVGGANSRVVEGMGVEESLGADASWFLWFAIPDSLAASPSPKLRLMALAAATSGAAKFSPLWAIVAAEGVYDTATLNDETTQTITWAAGDSDAVKELEVQLDAGTFAQADGGKYLLVQLRFETTSWTLAVASTWLAQLVVEEA